MPNYHFKTTWRSLWKDRRFAILNLIGLSVALACVVLIYLWAADETSVDKFHAKKDRLYQVMAHIKLPDGIHTQESTPYLLGRSLAKEMPEVETAVAFQEGYAKGALTAGDKQVITRRCFADNNFLDLFSYRLLAGNRNNALDDKYAVLLSEKLAKQLFNSAENAVGKTVQWQKAEQPFTVSGIFEESPNSSLKFDALFTYEIYYQSDTANANNWSNSNPFTFVLLKEGANAKQFESKLTGFLHAKYSNSPLTLSLRKYADRYLYDRYENGIQSGGRIRYVKLFSIIAAFILLIACINFMNLSTAKATRRLKDAGIKKILGAERSELIFQYISESILMAFMALGVALLLVLILLPQFNSITGKQLSLHFNVPLLMALAGIGIVTGLIAGSYPAFYLSGFKPATALKGKFRTVLGELWMRKGLVVFQYTLSVLFITAVIVIYKQMNLVRNIDLGYKKENILSFRGGKKIHDNYNAFMTDAKNIPGVTAASSVDGDMFGNASGSTERAGWEGKDPGTQILFTALDIDYELVELLGIQLKEGRSFSKNFGSDSSAIILNEAAIAAMGMKNPIGKTFEVWGVKHRIIGVAKDFHFESLHEKVKPCLIRLNPAGGNILIKIAGGKEREVITRMSNIYKEYNPGFPFEFSFMDKAYEAMYISEQREAVLLQWFTALAIIISCLGLFGLAAFSAQKRQKEMSIRKVVGASTGTITMLLSKDFFKLVLVAVLIAFPLSWWIMNLWLDNFAYRVSLDAGIFLLSFTAVVVITIITVSSQSIRAALANPIKSLRTE